MAAAAVLDPSVISTYTGFPQTSVQTLIDAPSAELVKAFIESIVPKLQDFEKLKAEKLRQDVELENTVRGSENRVQSLKSSADKAHEELETVRRQLNEKETAYANLESQIRSLESSSTTSSSEIKTLQTQIKNLEKSNRDTLALLDSKTKSNDKLAEDFATQHQTLISLRREISSLNEQVQTKDSELQNAHFRATSLQSEVTQSNRNNDWLESELKTKSEEYSKYRREKSARLVELQRKNEDLTSDIEVLRNTEKGLRERLEDIGKKADDAFIKAQRMQEETARRDESFRVELESSKRLADLQQQSAETARRRVQELDALVEQTKEEAGEEIGLVQAELETERSSKEVAEQRIEQLELQLEKTRTNNSRPATPHHEPNGLQFGTPAQVLSPSHLTPGSARARGGLSFTQMYSQYSNMQAELESEKERNEKMGAAMDEMIRDLEKKEPEMEELKFEHDRLLGEVKQLSSMSASANAEKDIARKEQRKSEAHIESMTREADLLRQQLRDLSAQVKVLLIEVQIRTEGIELTSAEKQELQRSARGGILQQSTDGMSDTGRFISDRLATFKNVFELQEQNARLLNLTRKLGEQMEGDEAKAKQSQQERDHAELESLREKCAQYKDEVKSLLTQSQAFIRERDMFRRMLSHRGQIPPDTDLGAVFGSSTSSLAPPFTPQRLHASADGPGTPGMKELADYAKLLKDMQNHFDAYRQEAATDHATLRNQVSTLGKEKGELQAELARASGQLTLAHERHEMLQANYNHLKTENSDIQKRSHAMADSAAKQDVRTQQVAEELVEAKGLADSLRNENANLKAEKELWRRVETRLNEDNRSLVEERARLNKTITDSQTLFNERELSESETRRKLQAQVESLESEMKTANIKLEDAMKENKSASLRREYNEEQHRTRVDDLIKSLGNVKEELTAAKTTRDQLQSRVDELRIELRAAQDRELVLQPRIATNPTTVSEGATGAPSTEDQALDHEQELQVEVTNLKKNLELTQNGLQNARDQVEQYKAISQSSEEELQNLNESFDQYREDSDKVSSEKDGKIRELEQRIDEISQELSVTNTQLSELRSLSDDSKSRLEQQKEIFDVELARVRDENERNQEAAKFYQEDLKAQAQIAQQAQQSYEDELVKHADAARCLQQVREDYNQLSLKISEAEAEAKAAKESLEQSEESWSEARDRYEQEISELQKRRTDVDNQNKLLHQQLDNVSSQISNLQRSRTSEESQGDSGLDQGLENLQEVIRYLRREKEIVDVQYELSVQEGKRLKQQLDYTYNQLEEARLKLTQERRRQNEEEGGAARHKKLLETINELNVYRESTVTLRNEARQAQTQLAEKAAEVERLTAQIEPLKLAQQTLENEKESAQGEIKLLQEDRDRWQKRTQDILHKYDRIDPAELEALKTRITELESEREQNVTLTKSLQEQVDSIPEQTQKAAKEATDSIRTRLGEQFKARSRELSSKINAAQRDNTSLNEQLESTKQELEQAKARLASFEQNIGEPSQAAVDGDVQMSNGANGGLAEDGEVTEQQGSAVEPDNQLDARSRVDELTARVAQLESELHIKTTEAQQTIDDLEQRLNAAAAHNVESAGAESSSNEHEAAGDVQKLRDDLAEARQQLERLNANTSSAPINSGGVEATAASQDNPELAALRADLEAQYNQKSEALEAQSKQRIENMKKQLNQKLIESRASIRNEVQQQHEEEMKTLRAEHDRNLTKLREEYEQALNELRKSAPTALATATDGNSVGEPQAESAQADWSPTDEQVKQLIQTNSFVKNLVGRNIKNKVEQELAKAKEEHDKQVVETQQKADRAKEQAISLEGKKWALKINRAENQARVAVAKIQIFEKAATDTPDKPVAEVWAIVKDYKPPAPAAQPPVPSVTAQPASSTPQTLEPAAATSQPAEAESAGNVNTEESSLPSSVPKESQKQETSVEVAADSAESQQTQVGSANTGAATLPNKPPTGGPARGGPTPRRGIPRPASAGSTRQDNSNTGKAAETTAAAARGTGRGTIRGRGSNGMPAQNANAASRGRGMSATAQQFVPGNKRPRESSTGQAERGDKRQRGGGPALQ